MRAFFYDTWGFLALANSSDVGHAAAAEADAWLETRGYIAATSDYVLDNTFTALSAAVGGRTALSFARTAEARVAGQDLLLVRVTPRRWDEALRMFRKLVSDTPRLSFTDCTSFALMRELGIELAFTADRHFAEAGKGVRPLFQLHGRELRSRLPTG